MRGKNLVKFLKAIDLIGRPQGITIDELGDELGIVRRSVYRVLEVVQELGVPIYDDDSERPKKWKIEEGYLKKLPNQKIPDLNLTLSEIIALYLLKGHERAYKGSDIEKKIDSAFAKIDAFVPEGLASNLNKIKTLFVPSSKFSKDYSGKEEIIEQLTDAMLQQKTCLVKYHSYSNDEIKEFKVDPLYFFEHKEGLYIFANATSFSDVIILAVERFQEVELTEGDFKYPEDFDPEERLDQAFGLVANDPIDVKIKFSADQARYIKERQWTKDQIITEQDDGSIIIAMKTSGKHEIKRWVLSYGADAELLEPKDLTKEIVEELKAAGKNYK